MKKFTKIVEMVQDFMYEHDTESAAVAIAIVLLLIPVVILFTWGTQFLLAALLVKVLSLIFDFTFMWRYAVALVLIKWFIGAVCTVQINRTEE